MYRIRTLGLARDPVQGDLADLVAISQGDVVALAAFYDRWARVVRAAVVRSVPGRGDADIDDVVEDVFWHVWRGVPESEGSSLPARHVDRWLNRLIYRSVARFYAGELAA